MSYAIRVENLSKRYRIRHGDSAAYRTLRDEIVHAAGRPLRWLRGERESSTEEFWALKDVSFDVQPGEVLGVIGRNGAGKSTLLKILSRITKPTSGRVEMRGRVGSLLEVGTGFHPELTGRENIYLSGAILGMKRAEIVKRFDEIVAFAEVEKFLDTPVKRYSSGMYVRLAFSVAAHLEPDILVIDEVLAVGDVAFRQKCLEKIEENSMRGISVLLVSHDMRTVGALCSQAVLLDRGTVSNAGTVRDVVQAYGDTSRVTDSDASSVSLTQVRGRKGSQAIRFVVIELQQMNGTKGNVFRFGEPFVIKLLIESQQKAINARVFISFVSDSEVELQGTCAHDGGVEIGLSKGRSEMECVVDPNYLTPGRYTIRAAIYEPHALYDDVPGAISFSIESHGEVSERMPSDYYVGSFYVPYSWREVPAHGSV